MHPFFKNINIFLAQKSIFLRKLSKNRTDFTRSSEFFRKITLKFSILWYPINPEKFPLDSITKLRKLFSKAQKLWDREGLWKWHENSSKFGRKSTGICRKMQVHQELRNGFHWNISFRCRIRRAVCGISKRRCGIPHFDEVQNEPAFIQKLINGEEWRRHGWG